MAASSSVANMHMCSVHAASQTPLRAQPSGRVVSRFQRLSVHQRCAASRVEAVDNLPERGCGAVSKLGTGAVLGSSSYHSDIVISTVAYDCPAHLCRLSQRLMANSIFF